MRFYHGTKLRHPDTRKQIAAAILPLARFKEALLLLRIDRIRQSMKLPGLSVRLGEIVS